MDVRWSKNPNYGFRIGKRQVYQDETNNFWIADELLHEKNQFWISCLATYIIGSGKRSYDSGYTIIELTKGKTLSGCFFRVSKYLKTKYLADILLNIIENFNFFLSKHFPLLGFSFLCMIQIQICVFFVEKVIVRCSS